MANLDDGERIRTILQLLQKQYVARQITSLVFDPPRNGRQLGVTFSTSDRMKAAERVGSISSLAHSTASGLGLEAQVSIPENKGDDYSITIRIYNPADPIDQTPAPRFPPSIPGSHCYWD
jgi:hypothetical protein